MSKVNENIKCKCGVIPEWVHIHREVYGMSGTHISGSERITCSACKKEYCKHEGEKIGLTFVLDGESN